ncbi:MAG: hypothetical protein DWQ05_06745 [Calditrichaeota bacterium]|nr:MAG: hypothetical protein DWQ05_06745 [Calditrichota bacterium]
MKYRTAKSSTSLYFVTSVISEHTSIFTNDRIAQIPLNSLTWFRKQNIWKVYAFCLMPNLIHVIIKQLSEQPIDYSIGKFHSYTGHEIIKDLTCEKQWTPLNIFKKAAKRIKTNREHVVWEDSLAKNIETERVLLKETEYIHNNPNSKNWQLAASRSEYAYSSACFYDCGTKPIIEIDDLRELL